MNYTLQLNYVISYTSHCAIFNTGVIARVFYVFFIAFDFRSNEVEDSSLLSLKYTIGNPYLKLITWNLLIQNRSVSPHNFEAQYILKPSWNS